MALEWFRNRVNLPLEVRGQLGGHSAARTWRPTTGMAGSEMVFAITREVKRAAANGDVVLRLGTSLESLAVDDHGTRMWTLCVSTDVDGAGVEGGGCGLYESLASLRCPLEGRLEDRRVVPMMKIIFHASLAPAINQIYKLLSPQDTISHTPGCMCACAQVRSPE